MRTRVERWVAEGAGQLPFSREFLIAHPGGQQRFSEFQASATGVNTQPA